MKGYRGFAAVLAVYASIFGIAHFAFGADAQPLQLSLLATDALARVAVVKFDDAKPRLWKQGDVLAAGKQSLRLRECMNDRAVVELIGSTARGAPQIVLMSVGQNYRFHDEQLPPAVNRLSPMKIDVQPR